MAKENFWTWEIVSSIGEGVFAAAFLIMAFAGFLLAPYSGYGVWLAISGVSLFILLFIYLTFLRPAKERRASWLEKWERNKRTGMVVVDENLKLVKGEKVVFGITPCYVEAYLGGFSHFPRDIIVTDRRIAIGFTVAALPPIKESFGKMNIWLSESLKENESGELGLLGGDSVASSMKIDVKDGEKILNVGVKRGPLNASYVIYHPKAEQIEQLFRDAHRHSK